MLNDELYEHLNQCTNSVNSIFDEWGSTVPSERMIAFQLGDISTRLHIMTDMILKDLKKKDEP